MSRNASTRDRGHERRGRNNRFATPEPPHNHSSERVLLSTVVVTMLPVAVIVALSFPVAATLIVAATTLAVIGVKVRDIVELSRRTTAVAATQKNRREHPAND